jgi:8-oxo-dGTP diphosphatase
MSHTHDPGYRFCPRCGQPLTHRCVKPGEPDRLCCDGCDFIFYLDPKLAAGAIVTLHGRIVLLRRSIEPAYGKWVFPGGFVDRGEHPSTAAVREAQEEAGIDIRLEEILGIYSHPAGSPVVLVVYRGAVVGGEPQALDESLEVGLFDPRELPWQDLAFATTRLALADFSRQHGLEVPGGEG